ncbi:MULTISPECIES: PP2C family protein-serine/threonine phosphatase [Streptomyces]|uniref:PP2C family protein-serine/threonine phosphatase n=1 Tax=Streptomyces TaxID=1883 RepID=UPI00224938E5|nr:PP2C family protein-serine/threonine phosphatase [Streptomyces sp. JHD 1]MCX2969087.1 PP2C family protein-serine/threonine phosphatase [Streptomyces sp. JHD 1]
MTHGGQEENGFDECLFAELVAQAQAAAPMDVGALVDRCARALDLESVVPYVADVQQRHLVPLTDHAGAALEIDASTAGWAYRTLSLRVEESRGGDPDEAVLTAWLPLLDGVERIGVLAVHTMSLDARGLRRCRVLSSLLALLISSKRTHSDSFARHTRTEPMRLGAEMLRTLLPPRTIGDARVISTGVLEPAYELGGDAFDHALGRSHLHAAIFDSVGHDLSSGLTTAVALAGCRNARRTGSGLAGLAETIDQALAQWLPEQFCTGILARLDLATGVLSWCNCGHPPPLLIRDQRVVAGAMEGRPQPPMGLPARLARTGQGRAVAELRLRPGDRVLFYTDGVTEARRDDGSLFGLEQFTDYIIRATAAGEPAPETLRRLIHEILDQRNELRDDATMLLMEWTRAEPRP